MKPLFIPLFRRWFEEFKNGTKMTEYRQYGPRWNERTCFPGRPVVLSLGYGKQNRITGKVKAFRVVPPEFSKSPVKFEIPFSSVAEIDIVLDKAEVI